MVLYEIVIVCKYKGNLENINQYKSRATNLKRLIEVFNKLQYKINSAINSTFLSCEMPCYMRMSVRTV